MQNFLKENCFDPEYLRSFIEERNRIPYYVEKHIRQCDICLGYLSDLNEKDPIPKIVFGKDFYRILKNTNVNLEDVASLTITPTFYARVARFCLKYRTVIEILCYGSVLFGIVHLFLYFFD